MDARVRAAREAVQAAAHHALSESTSEPGVHYPMRKQDIKVSARGQQLSVRFSCDPSTDLSTLLMEAAVKMQADDSSEEVRRHLASGC